MLQLRRGVRRFGISVALAIASVGIFAAVPGATPLKTIAAAHSARPLAAGCARAAAAGSATCLAQAKNRGISRGIDYTTSPDGVGLFPSQIKAAYNWPTRAKAGAGETIAIVDAFDNPAVEADLAVFDKQFGLPECTIKNKCLTKVNSQGGKSLPPYSEIWEFEISIDVQWAHAIAPGAKILLVEATTDADPDMYAAEDYAKHHAKYISNSWITNETPDVSQLDKHFIEPGVSFFAGSGDSGLSPGYPAASPKVVSVGGSQLNYDANGKLLNETGWSLGGGGCAQYEKASEAQADFRLYHQVGCAGMRAFPDVSANASDQSRTAVYDSNVIGGVPGGWFGAWGTSVATPELAARAADAHILVNSATIYSSRLKFRDITGGGNGATCLPGYNLCAGRGSWITLLPHEEQGDSSGG